MGSRELGLVLAQQLLSVEDLHYGLWDDDLELNLGNLVQAQQRYSEMLIGTLPPPTVSAASGAAPVRVLDIGCGTGHLLGMLLDRGYAVDGVIPAPHLAKLVREQQARRPDRPSRLFESDFEDFPADVHRQHYDVALFSESFQYIDMDASLRLVQQIVRPGGLMVICDFFKTEHHGDGGPGDRSFGGGHPLAEFYRRVQATPLECVRDDDITAKVSPNIELVNELLLNKIKPAGLTLDRYLGGRYPRLWWLARRLLRKKLERANYKYFSGHRSRATFERYKSYHLMVYRVPPS